MTIRQQIINKVKERLQTILVANGYNSNLGQNVYEWRVETYAKDSPASIEIRDISCETVLLEAHRHRLLIEAEIVNILDTTPQKAREMIADVIKVIGVDPQWSSLAINTYPMGDTIEMQQGEKIIGGAKVSFVIEFRTKEWDPYTQI